MASSGRIPMLDRGQVPPEVAVLYDALLAQRGVVPNMFRTLANVPSLVMGFAAFLKPLLADGALSGWYKELVATRVGFLNDCEYCVKAHTLSARQKGASEEKIAAVTGDLVGAPFTEAEKLGFLCAEKLHASPQGLDDAFYLQLKNQFTDLQIVELVAVASAFQMFSRLIEGLRIPVTPSPAGKQA